MHNSCNKLLFPNPEHWVDNPKRYSIDILETRSSYWWDFGSTYWAQDLLKVPTQRWFFGTTVRGVTVTFYTELPNLEAPNEGKRFRRLRCRKETVFWIFLNFAQGSKHQLCAPGYSCVLAVSISFSIALSTGHCLTVVSDKSRNYGTQFFCTVSKVSNLCTNYWAFMR
jgi:hypothetical protein